MTIASICAIVQCGVRRVNLRTPFFFLHFTLLPCRTILDDNGDNLEQEVLMEPRLRSSESPAASHPIHLPDVLCLDAITVDLKAREKRDAIRELLAMLEGSGLVPDQEAATVAVYERECSAPTGIGHGVAIPHGKVPGLEAIAVALGISRAGIDFDAPDGMPTHIVFLLVSPPHVHAAHLKLLAQIAHLMRLDECRGKLLACTTPEEVWRLLGTSFEAITHH